MNFAFQKTPLFVQAFSAEEEDAKSKVLLLTHELLAARTVVADLIQGIPNDCKGLTIHDVTHLDALWDIASIVVGGELKLNPAEGFVLGMAILVHDAGLTAASYDGGIDELRQTNLYKDFHSVIEKKNTTSGKIQTEKEIDEQSLFSTLRSLHAAQAENLLVKKWKSPSTGKEMRILDHDGFLAHYSRSIGAVAASHHWSISKLLELRSAAGVAPELGNDWVVDERKLAAIIRTADIAHIDSRRAPSMHYALQRPVGTSELHWRFQSKIAKPSVEAGLLTYTSGTKFSRSEANAWWLAFETVQQIDAEVVATNRFLSQIGLQEMGAKGAAGASSLDVFAKQCSTDGWTPIDASIKVTNPKQLAAAIGGRNLYGPGALAPVREILQNSADAITARRVIEGKGREFGVILVDLKEEGSKLRITVRDNGVGMSRRVMCGALIDFGRSLWSSEDVAHELPGLISEKPKIIGKYGIGFFSLFDSASDITVYSRRYDAARRDGNVLQFEGLDGRPVMYPSIGEDEGDFSTRIEFLIDNNNPATPPRTLASLNLSERLLDQIRALVVPLEIDVKVRVNGDEKLEHSHAIYELDGDKFLKNVDTYYDRRTPATKALLQNLLTDVHSASGEFLGRACLNLDGYLDRDYASTRGSYIISSGGFSTSSSSPEDLPRATMGPIPASLGIFLGEHFDVARRSGKTFATPPDFQKWLTSQCEVLVQSKISESDLMSVAFGLWFQGFDTGPLPVAYSGSSYLTLSQLSHNLENLSEIKLLLDGRSRGDAGVANSANIIRRVSKGSLPSDVLLFIQNDRTRRIVTEEENTEHREDHEFLISSSNLLSKFKCLADLIVSVWGGIGNCTVKRDFFLETDVPIFQERATCLVIERPQAT